MGSATLELLNAESLPSDEHHLVSRAAEGDLAAFEALYHRHVGRVYALCLRMTGDAVQAQELVQDAFVRAWERLGSFRGESAFASWLHRVAVNVVLQDRRARSRREARVRVVEDTRLAQSEDLRASDPGNRVDLEEAVARLPEGARTVFILHDIEGYKHQEIAAMTGVAQGTSKAQLHRARQLLRKALDQ